jgi:hypothetical protein
VRYGTGAAEDLAPLAAVRALLVHHALEAAALQPLISKYENRTMPWVKI